MGTRVVPVGAAVRPWSQSSWACELRQGDSVGRWIAAGRWVAFSESCAPHLLSLVCPEIVFPMHFKMSSGKSPELARQPVYPDAELRLSERPVSESNVVKRFPALKRPEFSPHLHWAAHKCVQLQVRRFGTLFWPLRMPYIKNNQEKRKRWRAVEADTPLQL